MTMFKSTRFYRILPGLSFLAFIGAVLCAVRYLLGPAQALHTSDSLDTLLWAEASYEAGSLVNPDFYYATLLPTGLHLLMVPFIAIFGFGTLAHTWGMIAFTLAFSSALLFFFRSLRWTWAETFGAAGIFLFATLGGHAPRNMFYGHILYYSQGLLYLFVGFGLLQRNIHLPDSGKGTRRGRVWMLLLGLFMTVTAINGSMTLALFTVPLIGGYVLEKMADPEFQAAKDRKAWLLLMVMGVAAALGLMGNLYLSQNIKTNYADGIASYRHYTKWGENLFADWIRVIVEPYGEMMVMSKDGLISALCMLTSILLFVIPLVGLLRQRKQQSLQVQALVLTYAVLFVTVLFMVIFTRYGEAEWRLIPLIFFGLIVSLVILRHWIKNGNIVWKRFGVLILSVLVVFSLKCAYFAIKMPVTQHDFNAKYIDFLKTNQLTYGYATYWNASNYTAYSDSQIKIRPVKIGEKTVAPSNYQSNKAWYLDQPGIERYFLAINANEWEQMAPYIPDGYAEKRCLGIIQSSFMMKICFRAGAAASRVSASRKKALPI